MMQRYPLQLLRRRAYRLRGLGMIVPARRLKFPGAWPRPAWMLPDPDLSKTLVAWQMRHSKKFGRLALEWGKTLRNLMGLAGGRAHIPRCLRICMR